MHCHIEMRNQIETNNFALEANLINVSGFGIKGETIISRMAPDYIRSTALSIQCSVFISVL